MLTYYFAKFFSENCMKIEEFGIGGTSLAPPLGSANRIHPKVMKEIKIYSYLKVKEPDVTFYIYPCQLVVLLKMAASPLPVFHTMLHITIQSRTPSLSLFNDPFILPKLYLANCVLQVLSDGGPKKFGGNAAVCG